MKIATVVTDRTEKIDALFKLWVEAAKMLFPEENIFVIRDKSDGLWINEVVGERLISNCQYQISDNYKMQAYRLIQEPVLVIDCDNILQSMPTEPRAEYAISEHTPGTASEFVPYSNSVKHLNCAAQYFRRDLYDQFKMILGRYLRMESLNGDFMQGEYASSELFARVRSSELLPASYAWFAPNKPYPTDLVGLHYGQGAAEMMGLV